MGTLEFLLLGLLLIIGVLAVMVIAIWLINLPSERARAARRK
jgi:ABC-type transporter Mla subunit MlaD